MKNICQIVIVCSGLFLSLGLPGMIRASGPEGSSEQVDGQMIGLASNALECLAISDDAPDQASGVVRLTWQGQAEQARLILHVAGSEAGHTIKVNGQAVAQAPIYPGGQLCSQGEVFYLDLPPEVVVQGDNLIEITNDALAGDKWSAAYVMLEVLGDIAVVPTGEPASPGSIDSAGTDTPVGVSGFTEVFTPTLTFVSSYDGSTQEFKAQIPVADINDCDTITPAPLVVYVHGRSSSMYEPFIGGFDVAPKDKGWLLASPELHGSWPTPPSPPGKYAYASLESQYDIIDTANYMVEKCNVKLDQIYLVGYSMGGQIATVVAAKYPHLFAAIFDNKGPTNMSIWHSESTNFHQDWMERECGGVGQGPLQNPFCYQRRSSVNFARNYIHIPISMTHSVSDTLVPIHHSYDLRDAINSYGPDLQASVYEDTIVGPTCGSPYHCYAPDPMAVLNFLEQYSLNNTPTHINITSDESKPFYWLNLVKTSEDKFSHVEVNVGCYAITATILDTTTTQLGFNLGTTPITDIIAQPGLGLPAGQYLVSGGGNNQVVNYTSGYLNVNVSSATTPYVVTLSNLSGQMLSCVYLPIILEN